MIDEINIFKVLDFIRDNAKKYAQAKAERCYIEEYRKSKKALLMREAETHEPERYKSAASQEVYAYASPAYVELLEGYREAVAKEEEFRFLLEGARLKAEAWRTIEANKRIEAKTL